MATKKTKTKRNTVNSAKRKNSSRNFKSVKIVKAKSKAANNKRNTSALKKKNAIKLGKTYLSSKELGYFKELIVQQKNEIMENARRLRESLVDENTGEYVGENTTFSMHMAEHGTDEMEREKAFMFIQRDEKHLFYLENALERIEKKTYGLCVSCGKPIDKGRLEAVPITQHCIRCKTTLSNGN